MIHKEVNCVDCDSCKNAQNNGNVTANQQQNAKWSRRRENATKFLNIFSKSSTNTKCYSQKCDFLAKHHCIFYCLIIATVLFNSFDIVNGDVRSTKTTDSGEFR